MIELALIDTSVNIEFFLEYFDFIDIYKVKNKKVLKQNIATTKEIDLKNNRISHGSICLSIILSNIINLKDIRISVIEILDADNFGNTDNLITGLLWCKENNVAVINLSLGTKTYFDIIKLHPVLTDIARRSTIISAKSNDSIFSYPAGHPDVISVESAKIRILKKMISSSNIIISQNKITEKILPQNKSSLASNSYACAKYCSNFINNYEVMKKENKKKNILKLVETFFYLNLKMGLV